MVVTTSKALAASLPDAREQRSIAVLAGPHDPSDAEYRPGPLAASRYLVFRHPALSSQEAVALGDERARALSAESRPIPDSRWWNPPAVEGFAVADYEDPVSRLDAEFAGPRLAGLAPVGRTGFVIVIESLETDPLAPEFRLGSKLVRWGGVSALPSGLLALAAVGFDRLRRMRRARSRRPAAPRGGMRG
jgi:hypothetical protein